jgi:CMP-N-acetylneuraminic acid synthetase
VNIISSSTSRHYLDLFTQRVKDSFTKKDTDMTSDTTRTTDMRAIQETMKQLHGHICVFLHAIEPLVAENETNLSKSNICRRLILLLFVFT